MLRSLFRAHFPSLIPCSLYAACLLPLFLCLISFLLFTCTHTCCGQHSARVTHFAYTYWMELALFARWTGPAKPDDSPIISYLLFIMIMSIVFLGFTWTEFLLYRYVWTCPYLVLSSYTHITDERNRTLCYRRCLCWYETTLLIQGVPHV